MNQTRPSASRHPGGALIHNAHDPLDRVMIGRHFQPPEGVRLESFLSRLVGMSPFGRLARSKPCVWAYLDRCSTIHTLTMTRRLDLVWVDAEGRVLRLDRGVPPLRMRRCPGARGVWERLHQGPSQGRQKGFPSGFDAFEAIKRCVPCRAGLGILQPSPGTADPQIRGTADPQIRGTADPQLRGTADPQLHDPAVNRQSGWGTLETLLALPILMLLFALIFQVAFLGIARLHLGHAMREGLRHASTPPEPGLDSRAGSTGQDPGSRFASGLADGLEAWARFYGDRVRSIPTHSGHFTGGSGWTGRLDAPVRVVWKLVPGRLSSAQFSASTEAYAGDGAAAADPSAQREATLGTRSFRDGGSRPGTDADSPDHLSASVSYAVPLKVPLVGAAFARALGAHLGCDQIFQGSQGAGGWGADAQIAGAPIGWAGVAREGPFASNSSVQRSWGSQGLCSEGGRWHWVLGTGGRMAVPPSLFSRRDGDSADSGRLPSPSVGQSSASGAAWGVGSASIAASPLNLPLNGSLKHEGSLGLTMPQNASPVSLPSALTEGGGLRSPEVLHRQSIGGIRSSARGGAAGGNTPVGGVSDSIRALLTEAAPAGTGAVHCPLQSG